MAIEADLSDPGTPAGRFDAADQHIGPVEILMNNATGPLKDTFAAAGTDRFARTLEPVSPTSWSRQFAIDVQAAALLIRAFGNGSFFVAGRAGELEAAIRHRLRMSDSVHAPYT
jgi:3-oxoacyl-[acyl-carrier protein] reductase